MKVVKEDEATLMEHMVDAERDLVKEGEGSWAEHTHVVELVFELQAAEE